MKLREEIAFKWMTPDGLKRYTGPQNAEEIMKAFDASYNRGRSKIEVSVTRKVAGIKITDYSSKLTMNEIDARYPRAEWLQMLLDRGITIESFNGYAHYMLKRHTLALLEDNPKLRESGILDIPPMDDWKTYKEAYINQLVKDHTKIQKTAEQIERAKAQLEHSKEQVEMAIERSKKEVELTKERLEHSKELIERVQKEANSQQFEHARKQLEHAMKQIEVEKELNSQQFEHARKQLEHAMKQIEHIQGTLEHPKEPIPPQAPTPPKVPTPPQESN